jgi:uncharacterized protein HemX
MVIEKNMAVILGVLLLAVVAFGLDMRAHGNIQKELAKTEQRINKHNQEAIQKLARENQSATTAQIKALEKKVDLLLERH